MNDEQPATPQQPAAASAGATETERIAFFHRVGKWPEQVHPSYFKGWLARAALQSPPVATAQQREAPKGTFACPICGYDKPHGHTEAQVAAYRDDQIRGDGWLSAINNKPKASGWYLCADVDVPRDQRSQEFEGSQLSWFLWVRDGASRGDKVPEVLYYDTMFGRWSLRNLLGNASVSGRESRWDVEAKPRLWREVPKVGAAPSPAHPAAGEATERGAS